MNNVAHLIDKSLTVLFAITIALCLFKAIELASPVFRRKRTWLEFMGSDARSIDEGVEKLETGLVLLATIAAAAPFIGLAGTVIHIVAALRGMSTGAVDMALVSGPIATALSATLWGLASAVPAAIVHPLLVRRIQVLENRAYRSLPTD